MTNYLTRLLMGLLLCTIVLSTAPAQAMSENSKEFVSSAREDWPRLEEWPSKKLVRAGKTICALLQEGYSPDRIVRYMNEENGLSQTKMRQFARTSTEYYCYWMTPVI